MAQPNRPERLLRRVRCFSRGVLQYDEDRDALVVWHWPIDLEGRRVSPEDLATYCQEHSITLPHCLCPMYGTLERQDTASVIVSTWVNAYSAREASANIKVKRSTDELRLESLHGRVALHVRCYVEEALTVLSQSARSNLRRSSAVVGAIDSDFIRLEEPRTVRNPTPLNQFLQLHSVIEPGLTEDVTGAVWS
ncbi:hypothetical protein DENSPDRAFT_855379 [Dentipellis sp. KUC8613]|nr:hypothetical protein DENSPDRAFT_855379 [Dentipellis sp. KUC8613]